MSDETFLHPISVKIETNWWEILIKIVDDKNQLHEFVASADSFYTERDGIWFSTKKEWDDYRDK